MYKINANESKFGVSCSYTYTFNIKISNANFSMCIATSRCDACVNETNGNFNMGKLNKYTRNRKSSIQN